MERTISIDKIIRDNWKIASGASNIIYNADQPALAALGSKSKKATGFGLKNGAVRFGNISRNSKGYLVAELSLPDGKFEITTKTIGLHSLGSLLAAASVASKMGMPGSKIAKGLSRIEGVNGRMKLLAGANGSRIIDDSYNASPKAVCSALDTLAEIPAGRRIAVLGSMVELGDASDAEHYKVGKYAAKKSQ